MDGKLSTYRTIDTLGKSQIDLILQVYDGALGAFKAAGEHYGNNELQGGYEQLERARKFLVHLYTTLNQEGGQEVASNLAKLYTFMICQIDAVEANHDASLIASNITILENLRAAWADLREQENAQRRPVGAGAAGESGSGSFTTSG